MVFLFKRTLIGKESVLEVAYFSSRRPNKESPGILKTDILRPGVNILTAWLGSLENKSNIAKSTFDMISGTSKSCRRLIGIAALLKSAHPDWSLAAIKSAIMTTTDIVNLESKSLADQRHVPAHMFAVGAGHVNPTRTNDPGLTLHSLCLWLELHRPTDNRHCEHQIVTPEGVQVSVKPDNISFTNKNQKVTYAVTFNRSSKTNASSGQGYLGWGFCSAYR